MSLLGKIQIFPETESSKISKYFKIIYLNYKNFKILMIIKKFTKMLKGHLYKL